MHCKFLILALVFSLNPQQPAQRLSPAPAQHEEKTPKVDPKLHADVLKLIDVSGTRERLKGNVGKLVEEGKKKMMESCKACSQEFADEWGKRMSTRINTDDFVDVTVRAYEKHLTDADVNELIAMQQQAKTGAPAILSPALKEKMTSVFPALMADISAGCVQIATKLGAEIGAEVERDHPEYIKASPEPPTHNR